MARTNVSAKTPTIRTHEGGKAKLISPEQMLRRSVMACMLWEDTFYEDGVEIATRISELVKLVPPEKVAEIAVAAREEMHLRHVPLLLVRELARKSYPKTAETLARVIQRADELSEFLSLYQEGRTGAKTLNKLSHQVQRGLAQAFRKFDEYQLAKYNRDTKIKLRDVLFLCHAKPVDAEQAALWKRLVDGKLVTPDTWEVAISATKGENKKEAWGRLLNEKKLGGMALLRNLRNMKEAGVSRTKVIAALTEMRTDRILPFRFIAAEQNAQEYAPQIEAAMLKSCQALPKLAGHTVILIDHSGSMEDRLSGKSEMRRIDAACALAIIAREISEDASVYAFSDDCVKIPARRGFALRDAVLTGMNPSGTMLDKAIAYIDREEKKEYDRLIVITDEQTHDNLRAPSVKRAYVINTASYRNGVGYGQWLHIDGWSDAVLNYIHEYEAQ